MFYGRLTSVYIQIIPGLWRFHMWKFSINVYLLKTHVSVQFNWSYQ